MTNATAQALLDKFKAQIRVNGLMSHEDKNRAIATLINCLWPMMTTPTTPEDQARIKSYQDKSLRMIEGLFEHKSNQL